MLLEMPGKETESPIGVLYDYYAERYPLNNDRIWEYSEALQKLLRSLPQEQQECISNAVALLVAEHEKEAFLRGTQTGIRLSKELNGEV